MGTRLQKRQPRVGLPALGRGRRNGPPHGPRWCSRASRCGGPSRAVEFIFQFSSELQKFIQYNF